MKNNRMKDALENIARRGVPENINLWPNISVRLERKSLMTTLRTRPVLLLLTILLALTLLTGVVYAIGRLTGYIPGIGFVETSSLRVLAEPVTVTREGITVSIEQVVADSERTIIVYKTEGLTIAAANSKGEGGGPFGSPPLLHLPDGTTLEESTGYSGTPEPLLNTLQTEGGWPNYVWRLVYPPVSLQVNELTLVIPVLQNMPAGAAPENWTITFRLKPTPPEMTLAPIITFAAPSESVNIVTPSIGETTAPALSNVATLNGFTFQLDNVIELEDSYVFTGNLSWVDSAFPTGKGMIYEAAIPTLTDASGQIIPIEEVPLNAGFGEHNSPWSYRTNRKNFSGPLTFSISSIKTSVSAPPVDFEIDFGSNPQVGQRWDVNRNFQVEGYTIRLLSVELSVVPDTCQGVGVNFNFSSDSPGIYADVGDVVPSEPMICSGGGGGGGGPFDPTIFSTAVSYKDMPVGPHHFSIRISVPYVVNGPWQVAWNPPLTAEPTPTPEPGACLTLDKWNQLSGRNDPLPPELEGKILISVDPGLLTPMPEPLPNFPLLQISNVDGSDRRSLVNGGWTALSPDGTRLIYTNENGFNFLDLSSGQDFIMGVDGYAPVWSPDGSRILYTTFDGMYLMQADGSGSQKIDVGAAQIINPIGWLPDNQTIIYSIYGEGFTFMMRNLQSGEKKELFSVQTKHGFGTVSPNGQWIAFSDHVFGSGSGVFVSRLDGSERRLVASPDISMSFYLSWSPDGRWLLVNTSDYQQSNPNPVYKPVLIELATCQVVGLPPTLGDVLGWAK